MAELEPKTFYQSSNERTPHVFAGRLPHVRVPNMSLGEIVRHYNTSRHNHFYLFLKNGLELSVVRRGKLYYEFMEVRKADGKVTKYPRFLDHDGFGVETVYPEDVVKRVLELGAEKI